MLKTIFLVITYLFCYLAQASQETVVYYQSLRRPNQTTFYLLSLPELYQDSGPLYPAFVYLPGAGEWGTNVSKYSDIGPFYVIKSNAGNTREDLGMGGTIFIVPNMPSLCNFNVDVWLVREALRHAASLYRIDLHRVAFAGISVGGAGVVQFISAFPDSVAASVILSGANKRSTVYPEDSDGCFPMAVAGPADVSCTVFTRQVHLWLFHGTDDYVGWFINPPATESFYHRLKRCDPGPLFQPRFSFVEGAHHSKEMWDGVFLNYGNGTWSFRPPGQADLSRETIFQWAKRFSLPRIPLQVVETAAVDSNGDVNLVLQNRPPRVTASSFLVSRNTGIAFWPSNVVDHSHDTAWRPAIANVSDPEDGHFLYIDFMETVQLGGVVVIMSAGGRVLDPTSWVLTTHNLTHVTANIPNRGIETESQDLHRIRWKVKPPVKARALKLWFPVSERVIPSVLELEVWGYTVFQRASELDLPLTTPTLLEKSDSIFEDEVSYSDFDKFVALEGLSASSGFVACYCDDFEEPLPKSGSGCQEPTSLGWNSDWESKFVAVASPSQLTSNPREPWSVLQGEYYLRFQAAVDNQWDCMTSRTFWVLAGVPVQLKFRMAVPMPNDQADNFLNAENLFKVETKAKGEMLFVERAVISFPQDAMNVNAIQKVSLGTPNASQLVEVQFSVFSTDHFSSYFNIDCVVIEFQSSVCPAFNEKALSEAEGVSQSGMPTGGELLSGSGRGLVQVGIILPRPNEIMIYLILYSLIAMNICLLCLAVTICLLNFRCHQ